jgi:hypothetical protein
MHKHLVLRFIYKKHMVGLRGLEPPTPAMSTRYSNQLSYKPICGADDRNRTGTGFKARGILSPVRLPVPPHRQKY